MENLQRLDEIILSDNVKDRFYQALEDKAFVRWLEENLPEILICHNTPQNNPWHIYDVLGHILKSVEAINSQTKGMPENERRLLAFVMLFHDIGKPQTKIQRMKNGQLIDSFFNHNVESERIAKERLGGLGFNEEEIKTIAKLVYKHDIFMFIKASPSDNPHWRALTPQLIEEEIADLSSCGDGEKLLRWLVMIGRSDNLAQNPQMIAESLQLVDLFDKMIDQRDLKNEI